MERLPSERARRPRATETLGAAFTLIVLSFVLSGCESGDVAGHPEPANVRVQGQVTDPSGAAVAEAEVTLTLHETDDCVSPVLSSITGTTASDGRFDALPGVSDTGPGFEPRQVCLEVEARPPADRPDLGPSEVRTFVVTLRRRLSGDEPIDVVEVDLTLPPAGGG